MGFIKDKKSYHSIGPVECKELVFRDAFIVNISAKIIHIKHTLPNISLSH